MGSLFRLAGSVKWEAGGFVIWLADIRLSRSFIPCTSVL